MNDWGNLVSPEKVFIEREGIGYEYSEQQPGGLEVRLNSLLQGHHGTRNLIELFYCVPEVAGAVKVIAEAVSDAVWELKMFKDDKVVFSDNDFNRLFTQPNPLNTIRSLIYNAVCTEILTGKQFFYFNQPSTLAANYQNVLSWSNLPAEGVCVEMKKGVDVYSATELKDFVTEYKVGDRSFSVDKILPIVHTSLRNGFDLNDCKSPLLGAQKAIENLIPVYEARGAIYIKRGALGMWVSRKSDQSGNVALTPSEKKAMRDEMDQTYGLNRNKETVGITSQYVDFVKTSMSIAEMQPFDETLADAVAIYSCLGIPRSMVPSKDHSTFNNVNSDKKDFYTGVVMPWAKRYADGFTNQLKLNDSRRYIHASFKHIGVLQEDRKEKADVEKIYGEVFLQRWQSGVCSLNDWIIETEGEKGVGNLYEKKIFDLTPDEITLVKSIINLKVTIREAIPAPGATEPIKPIPNEPIKK